MKVVLHPLEVRTTAAGRTFRRCRSCRLEAPANADPRFLRERVRESLEDHVYRPPNPDPNAVESIVEATCDAKPRGLGGLLDDYGRAFRRASEVGRETEDVFLARRALVERFEVLSAAVRRADAIEFSVTRGLEVELRFGYRDLLEEALPEAGDPPAPPEVSP